MQEIFNSDFFHNEIGFEKQITENVFIPFRYVYNGKKKQLQFYISINGYCFELFLRNKKLYKYLVDCFYEVFGDNYYDGK